MLDLIVAGSLMLSPETENEDTQREMTQERLSVERHDVDSEYVYTLGEQDTYSSTSQNEGEVVIITVVKGRTQRIVRQGVQYDPEQSGLDH